MPGGVLWNGFQRWLPCHLENNFPPQASHHACSSYTSIPLPSSFTLQLFMCMLQINTLHVPLLESWVLLAFAMWTLWCLYCRSMFFHQEPCVLSMGSFSANCKITKEVTSLHKANTLKCNHIHNTQNYAQVIANIKRTYNFKFTVLKEQP